MKVAVTGTTGQVVTSLVERGTAGGHEMIRVGRPDLDLTEPLSVIRALAAATPDVIVSAAAYTLVDKAEADSDLAFAVNEAGARSVAQAAKSLGVPLIHISTDYVFDGTLDRAYVETDQTRPTGVYAASKLAGERAVLETYENSALLRTAWIYSPFGNNFVKTMLRLATGCDLVSVVADQVGNPTSALAIADGILDVAANLLNDSAPALRGVFHMTAQGEASWADFAQAIFEASAARGRPFASVRRIGTVDYPTPAVRPANSRLNCAQISTVHGITLPNWRQSLDALMDRLQPPEN